MTTSSTINSAWTIGSVLSESWRKVAGFKATYAIAMIIYVAIAIAVELLMGLLFGWDYAESGNGGAVILEIVISIAMIPLGVGLGLIGIRRAAGKPVSPTVIFEPYQHALPLIVMMIMGFLLIIAGYLLFIIPGIYLSIAYSFSAYLITEKNMGAWQALEASRKAITKFWWRYFGLMLISVLLVIAGVIPFLIGLIWVLPLVTIAVG